MDKAKLEALAKEYTSGLWWITMIQTWAKLAEIIQLEVEIEERGTKLLKLKEKYAPTSIPTRERKRGRPKKVKVPEITLTEEVPLQNVQGNTAGIYTITSPGISAINLSDWLPPTDDRDIPF